MARGRMLNRSLAQSVQFMSLANDTHRLLFVMAIPHLDREGRMTANPRAFRATACPMLDHITDRTILEAFNDFSKNRLIDFYTDDGSRDVYSSPGFKNQQQGMRYDREAPSKFGCPPGTANPGKKSGPPPDSSGAGPETSGYTPESQQNEPTDAKLQHSGPPPESVRSQSGGLPLKLKEVNANQISLSQLETVRTRARAREGTAQISRERESPELAPEGTRLDPNWEPSEELIAWCSKDPWVDMPRRVVLSLTGFFKDKWLGEPGRAALRVDWNAQARMFYRHYRETHQNLPRASAMVVEEEERPPPPKHPSLAKIESAVRVEEPSSASTSELMTAIGRVGVGEPEEK
jgi:hypothetical protein